MRRSIILRLPLILALAACAPAWAATCKYIDADGHVIYSNTASTPPKGAKKEKCFEDPKPAAAAPEAAPTQSPEGRNREFPKVDDKTQKRRDTERRRILEEEL